MSKFGTRVLINVQSELKAGYRELAKVTHQTQSQLMREALQEYLEKETQQRDTQKKTKIEAILAKLKKKDLSRFQKYQSYKDLRESEYDE